MGYFGTRKVSPFCARPKRSHYKLQGRDVTNRAQDKSVMADRQEGFQKRNYFGVTRGPRIVSYTGRIRTMRACVCRFSKGNELRREEDSFETCSTR